MNNRQVAIAFQSDEVQKIAIRSVKKMIRKYDDKNLEYDELVNQSYICFHSLMNNFRYDGQIEDFSQLPIPALGYIGIYLPLRLEEYIWKVCGIHRTKTGYKKDISVEFNTEYHGGSIKGKFERDLEMNEIIDEALFELSDNQRDLMILEFFEDRTPYEIATRFNVKPSTYRKRKFDGLATLKKIMSADQDLLQGAF